jgi:hypothetical protein
VLITSAVLIAGLTGGLLSGAPSYASPVSPFHSVTHRAAQPEQAARPSELDGTALEAMTDSGALTGTVLGAAGTQLPGACVTAIRPSTDRTVLAAAGSGRYAITGLPPGTYTVSFADCASKAEYVRQWYGGSYTAAGAGRVRVLPGQTVSLRPVILRPATPEIAIAAERHALDHDAAASKATATIAGKVLGPKGQRLRGMCAIAWIGAGLGLTEEAVPTLHSGAYKLGIAVSRHHVDKITMQFTSGCGSNANYAPQWWKYTAAEAKATTLSVRAGTHLTGIDARLSTGGVVRGTVRADSAHGKPLAGVCVQAIGGGLVGQIGIARTKANGSYRVTALGTGRYLLTFSPGCGNDGNYLSRSYQPVRVTAGKTTRLSAFLHPGGTISGTVASAGSSAKPLSGICVTATSSPYGGYVTRTVANGTYSMPQLPPGRYQVSFAGGCGNKGSYAPQYYPAQLSSEASTKIRISYGLTVAGVDASMAPGATITGKVTGTTGRNLRGVCPLLLTAQQLGGLGPTSRTIPGGPIFPTSARGTYRITNLAPGPYYVLFSDCLGAVNLAPVWYSAASQLTSATAVSADAGTVTTGIDAVMRTGGTISGTILGRDGRPVRGACPLAYDPAAPGQLSEAFGILSGPSASGRYRLTGLPTGSYRVQTVLCFGNSYASQWYRDQDAEASASPVTVRAGHVTAGIDFRLHGGGSVSGRVTSAAGKPLANVCVLLDNSRGEQVDLATTADTGHYLLTEEPPGVYTVKFAYCPALSPPLAPAEKTGVRISATRPVRGVNAVMRPGASISGTVLGGVEGGGAPTPAAGVCVEAAPKSGIGVATTAVTGANGHYDLTGLAAGTYSLLFTDYCNGGAPLPLAPLRVQRLIPVGRNSVATLNVTMQADGQITGTVDGPGSKPLAGICVTAQPIKAGTSPVLGVTTATGSYSIGSLVPGSYRVEFSAGCGTTGYRTMWFNNARSAATATPVEVEPGEPTNGISAVLAT